MDLLEDMYLCYCVLNRPTLLRNDQVLNKIRHNVVRERNVCVSSNFAEEEPEEQ